jgi:mxaJ protein
LRDSKLESIRVGVQLIGNGGFNTPPAQVLGEEGIVNNVIGFPVYGDYRQQGSETAIIRAVEDGQIDIAAVWGPLAGYYARLVPTPLEITPIEQEKRFVPLRFDFAISMGVRKGDHARRDLLNGIIESHQPEIDALLTSYGVPLLALTPSSADAIAGK